jgi:hypothetical protein
MDLMQPGAHIFLNHIQLILFSEQLIFFAVDYKNE